MTVATSIKKGDILLEKEEYDVAITEFNNALKDSPSSFKALMGKSIAHQRLKQFDESLKDLLLALQSSREKNNRENIGLSYLRLAIIYFNKKEIGKSLRSINLAKQFGANDPSFGIWFTKITKKATKEDIKEEDIDELETPITASIATPAAPAVKTSVATLIPPEPKTPKMSYYQSNERITIDFFYKNVTNPAMGFKTTSLNVEFKTLTGSDVIYEYKLFAPIIPEECSFKIMSTKIEVSLRKLQLAKWSSLEGSGKVLSQHQQQQDPSSSSSLLYPTSSKNKTNWSNIQIDDDEDENDKEAAENDENAFFQQLYASADDDTKRAMMKSFVESNGTALSTNWKETKDKNWETSPPEGVEAKKW